MGEKKGQSGSNWQYRDLSRLIPLIQEQWAAGRTEEARRLADAALALKPEERMYLEALAGIYIDLQDAEKAGLLAAQLLEHFGADDSSLFLAARAALLVGGWREAWQMGQSALSLPGLSSARQCLLQDILGRAAKELGNMQAAAQHHLQAAELAESLPERLASYSNYLLDLHYLEEDGQAIYKAACRYDSFFSAVIPFSHERHARHEKLRIGYISPDFRAHIAACFSWALLADYDRECFEVYCYANCQEDDMSRQLAGLAGHWRNIRGLSPQKAAAQIYGDEIDILVELAGHTRDNGLPVLAFRPAPVQVSGIGYMSTTGLSTVDYFLSDSFLDGEAAPGAEMKSPDFSETLLQLPDSHFCWHPFFAGEPCGAAPVGKNGFVTFGSLNQFGKLTAPLLRAWREILGQVPRSRLFLKCAAFNSEEGRQQAYQLLQAAGIPPERLRLEGYTQDYSAAYRHIDIALDTYPYTGGGTTCDALYMGVPVITLAGRRHGARFGRSLLMNLGLGEYCADSWEAYIAKAVELAGQPAMLRELRRTLRRRMEASPLMDGPLYMAGLEAAYQRIWQQWREGQESPEERMAEAAQLSRQLLAALPAENWPVVLRSAGRLCGMGCAMPQMVSAAGFAYLQQQNPARAIFWLRRVLRESKVNDAENWQLLGDACQERMDMAGARDAYEQAWQCQQASGHYGSVDFQRRLFLVQAHLYHRMGAVQQSAAYYKKAFQLSSSLQEQCSMYSSYLLVLQCTDMDADRLAQEHRGYADLFRNIRPLEPKRGGRHPEKLRIGYISPDFRQHVMFSFYYALLACYDTAHYEIYCYSMGKNQDVFTARVRNMTGHWRDVSQASFEEIARQIREDGIDILVDLGGHTADSGLPVLAWRPAPVQLSGLGYMDRTGLPSVDYLLTDIWCDPPGTVPKDRAGEKSLYLPSQFCYTAEADLPAPQGSACQRRGYVLFGVFNHYYKITDDMLLAWRAILEQIPNSRLLLKSQSMAAASVAAAAYERLQQLGFDMDRVMFEPATMDYMQRYLDVDIALDTYPYTGGGTTCDALYMGVPVISRYGERRSSRFGLSILQGAGVGELAAASQEEYIAKASALARDWDTLEALHLGLRNMLQASVLMDGMGYTRALEQQYEKIWAQKMAGR